MLIGNGLFVSAFVLWAVARSEPSVEEMLAKMESDKEARVEAQMRALERLKDLNELDTAMDDGASHMSGDMARMGLPPAARLPKRQSKQIAVKRARAFMREVMAALTTDDAKIQIEEARAKGAAMATPPPPKELLEEDSEAEGNARDSAADDMLMTVGPVVDKLVKGTILKYEFEGGFQQAMSSVSDAMNRKGDKELKASLEAIAKILAPAKAARVPQLGPRAAKFIDMSNAEREDAIKYAENLREDLADEKIRMNVDEYWAAMRGIVANGSSHVKDAIAALVLDAKTTEEREHRKLTSDEQYLFNMRVDTLMEFISPANREAFEAQFLTDEDAKTEL